MCVAVVVVVVLSSSNLFLQGSAVSRGHGQQQPQGSQASGKFSAGLYTIFSGPWLSAGHGVTGHTALAADVQASGAHVQASEVGAWQV